MGYFALITGASSGIGLEMAHYLAQGKRNLILIARRSERLEELKAKLESQYKVTVKTLTLDLAEINQLHQVQNLLEEFEVDFFINNAGLCLREDFINSSIEKSQTQIDLNISALTKLCHFALENFKEKNNPCYLLNVGSVNSYIPISGQAVYAATKSYVKSLSLSLNEEFKDTHIQISCLCPGGTKTELLDVAGINLKSSGEKFMMEARDVAIQGINGTLTNKAIIIPGLTNKLSVIAKKLLPEKSYLSISSKIYKSMVEE